MSDNMNPLPDWDEIKNNRNKIIVFVSIVILVLLFCCSCASVSCPPWSEGDIEKFKASDVDYVPIAKVEF